MLMTLVVEPEIKSFKDNKNFFLKNDNVFVDDGQ